MSVAPSLSVGGGIAHRGKIVGRVRQIEQRQGAVGVARAQPVERVLRARQRAVQRLGGNAVLADIRFKCAVD